MRVTTMQATGYISGHDHCLEYLEDISVAYVLSGTVRHVAVYGPG